MEVIVRIIIGLILNYPGEYVRWLFFKKDKPFKKYLEDVLINETVAAIIIISLILLLVVIFKS